MTYLVALLFLAADDARAEAKERYAKLVVSAEREYLENELRNAKAGKTSVQVIKTAQSNLELWKEGLYRPPDQARLLPHLGNPDTLKVGDIGRLMPFFVASVIDENTALIRTRKSQIFDAPINTTPFLLSRRTDDLEGLGPEIEIKRIPFWVSGRRTVGRQMLFVIEPLRPDE